VLSMPSSYAKYVVLDYSDFTIKQFELHSPSSSKELMVHGHGRLRSTVHKIYNTDKVLNFYTPPNSALLISDDELHKFQSRKVDLVPAESIQVDGESRDYELAHSPAFENRYMAFIHHSQLLNRKPAIHSSADLDHRNYHDVLTVKPGRLVSLRQILRQVSNYGQVHCFFCRTRSPGQRQF